MSLYSYLFGWKKLNIRKADRVLEVGSGDKPYMRSDVLCDKLLIGKAERGGPIFIDRPFVVCDATALPFADQSFDYVICSHVAEHVDAPEKLFEELMRVAKRGYIETPNRYYENILGWRFHKWFVTLKDGKLLLQSKQLGHWDEEQTAYFHHIYYSDANFRKLWNRCEESFLIKYEWNGKIEYELVSDPQGEGELPKQLRDWKISKPPPQVLRRLLRRRGRSLLRRVFVFYREWIR